MTGRSRQGPTAIALLRSLTSVEKMWRPSDALFFWGIFSSVTLPEAVLSCELMKGNEFPSPSLLSNMQVVTMGQTVSLFCSHKNISLQISYMLFLSKKYVDKKSGTGEPVIFDRTISKADDLGPYKCKAQVFNCSKYSQEFNFTLVEENSCPSCLLRLLLPLLLLLLLVIILILVFWLRRRHKARKAMRENVPRESGDIPMEGELYANICRNQTGAGHFQELHYAIPVFQEVAPGQQEACYKCKNDYIYSEFTF